MCRKYQKVGQMEFGNKVDISDPCYERDGESNVIDYGIESGTYGCYIKFGKEEYGEEYRIAEIAIIKKGYENLCSDYGWIFVDIIGVDSGLCGFFNHKKEYSNSDWTDFCHRLEEANEKGGFEESGEYFINFDNGFFSNTGWGDGSYETYKYTLEDKVVGLKVIFMEH